MNSYQDPQDYIYLAVLAEQHYFGDPEPPEESCKRCGHYFWITELEDDHCKECSKLCEEECKCPSSL